MCKDFNYLTNEEIEKMKSLISELEAECKKFWDNVPIDVKFEKEEHEHD